MPSHVISGSLRMMFVCYQVLQDMVPPKKHLLRHQPANAQIGLMEGNTFCTTLQPRLFTMDLSVVEHKVFYTEVSSVHSRNTECQKSQSLSLSLTHSVTIHTWY